MAKELLVEIGRDFLENAPEDSVAKGLEHVLDRLSIDVAYTLTVSERPAFLSVNRQACLYPKGLPKEIKGMVQSEDTGYGTLLTEEVLWLRPSVLFTPELLPEYMPGISETDGEEVKTGCLGIIREILDLKIALKDRGAIASISTRHLSAPVIDWNTFREDLISALRGKEIVLGFDEDFFYNVLLPGSQDNMLKQLRSTFFNETGIRYPPFKVHIEKKLPGHFSFRINDYIAKGSLWEHSEQASDYYNCLGNFLRKNGFLCIDQSLTMTYLREISDRYAVTVNQVKTFQQEAILTQVLRLLAKDQLSIRNFAGIAQKVLSSDYIIADGIRHILFDDRVPIRAGEEKNWKNEAGNITEFVRMNLKREISFKYTGGSNNLKVYLLDPDLEQSLVENPAGLPQQANLLKQLEDLEPGAPILTASPVRQTLRRLLENAYPDLPVLSYSELTNYVNVQVISRIYM